MFDLLSVSAQLIAADTVSHHGTAAAVDVLKPLYEAAGLVTQVQELRRGSVLHQNLLGTLPGTDAAGLLLVTHLDSVDPGPRELWTETGNDPFRMTRSGDKVFGLGSADTKLDSLCKLSALATLRNRTFKRSVQLLGTYEEEVGCKGARHFVGSPDFKARFVSCSEPSELRLIRAHKGYAVVRVQVDLPNVAMLEGPFEQVVFQGKSAHSSTPHLGQNAIEAALSALHGKPIVSLHGGTVANKVPDRCVAVLPGRFDGGAPVSAEGARDAGPTLALCRELHQAWVELSARLEPQENPSFNPATTVTNWGAAHLDGAHGEVLFDCRLLPGHAPEALMTPFQHKAAALAAKVGARLSMEIDRANPAAEIKEPSQLLAAARAACRDVGISDVPETKPTNTEAGVFNHAGVEAMVFGPGRSTGNAHTPNEHNLYSQMEKAIEFYRALITRMCIE